MIESSKPLPSGAAVSQRVPAWRSALQRPEGWLAVAVVCVLPVALSSGSLATCSS